MTTLAYICHRSDRQDTTGLCSSDGTNFFLDYYMNTVWVNRIHPRVSSPAAATAAARTEREHVTLKNIGGTSAQQITAEKTNASAQWFRSYRRGNLNEQAIKWYLCVFHSPSERCHLGSPIKIRAATLSGGTHLDTYLWRVIKLL